MLVWCWFGVSLLFGWYWFGISLAISWYWFGIGAGIGIDWVGIRLGLVWHSLVWCSVGIGLVLFSYGIGLVLAWYWLGILVSFWYRFGIDGIGFGLVLVWYWFRMHFVCLCVCVCVCGIDWVGIRSGLVWHSLVWCSVGIGGIGLVLFSYGIGLVWLGILVSFWYRCGIDGIGFGLVLVCLVLVCVSEKRYKLNNI